MRHAIFTGGVRKQIPFGRNHRGKYLFDRLAVQRCHSGNIKRKVLYMWGLFYNGPNSLKINRSGKKRPFFTHSQSSCIIAKKLYSAIFRGHDSRQITLADIIRSPSRVSSIGGWRTAGPGVAAAGHRHWGGIRQTLHERTSLHRQQNKGLYSKHLVRARGQFTLRWHGYTERLRLFLR